MQKSIICILMGAVVLLSVGCSQGEVTEQDQVNKVKSLHKAEEASRAKDGIKSE